ncbi:MAG: carboxylic acid reductase [Pseudonocardia sp.]|nr:carboxylic acid reductase [Pseudonocardia sp.]
MGAGSRTNDAAGGLRDARDARLERRVAELYAKDRQFADARPSEAITAAIHEQGLGLGLIVRTVMEGYADRPAVAQRAVELVHDPQTGRTRLELLPRFETISYRELWNRVGAVAAGLVAAGVRPGDRVCLLGFTSVDYTTVDMSLISLGAVAVPLQTSVPVVQLRPIVAETQPTVIASSVESLADAVELVLTGYAPAQLIVFDYHPEVDDQCEAVHAAQAKLAEAGSGVIVETLDEVVQRGESVAGTPLPARDEDDPLMLLIYTSGSTGTPKGAMYPEHLVARFWRGLPAMAAAGHNAQPWITLNFMPMSHVMGRWTLYATLGNGGTVYFAAKSDLSTFLEDLALARPTQLDFMPRVWEMLFAEFHSRLDGRARRAADQVAREADVTDQLRRQLLGGRFIAAHTGSAPISAEVKSWVESFLDLHLVESYGATEVGGIFVDGQVQRPPITDYKLADVPDLGYFRTDRPHPRGELLVKSEEIFAGYYQRPQLTAEVFDPEGYYRTGDIVTEVGPDQLEYLDRRNNVLKLSQGEFVTVSKLEAVFEISPLVRQIYLYGNSARSYLVAVIVPTEAALSRHDTASLKALISESLQDVAKAAGLQSYEIPQDFIIETTPFTLANGLLTGIRKLARPKLKQRYGARLEQLYTELAKRQENQLRSLRQSGADRPALETISRAAAALLGTAAADVRPNAHFTDLGGDSLSALTFANLLRQIFDLDVPVGVIISPATDVQALATYIQAQRRPDSKRPTFAAVHGRHASQVHARDLTPDKFLDSQTLAAAPSLPHPSAQPRTVLLTGATGFLGRYLALDWLERLSLVDGKLICLVRAKNDAAARQRLDNVFDSGDPRLLAHYRHLAAEHLEVITGDKGEPNLGLDQHTWQRLAHTVDLIVDPAALVNHVLPYRELFEPNVLGTAELTRLALTTKLKPFTYVSTLGVGDQIAPSAFTENADIRIISPTRALDDSYANGYATSKWASEVLLRQAHELYGLPVAVFRCDMILTDTRYVGQLNLPDMFTRLMFSLVATGVAPGSFYELGADGNRRRAHYDGLPVDFIAEAIATFGQRVVDGFQTYHVANPHDDGVGLDEFVDWLIDAGYPIARIANYDTWLRRFETAMRALPEKQRQHSFLPLLHSRHKPQEAIRGPAVSTERFRAAVQEAKIGPDKDIPHIERPMIIKYITNLQLLGLL